MGDPPGPCLLPAPPAASAASRRSQHEQSGQLHRSLRSPALRGGRRYRGPPQSPPFSPLRAAAAPSIPLAPFPLVPALSCRPSPAPRALCLKGASVYAPGARHSGPQGWMVRSLQGWGGWTGRGRWRGPKAGTAPSSSVTSKASRGLCPPQSHLELLVWAMQPWGQILGLGDVFPAALLTR